MVNMQMAVALDIDDKNSFATCVDVVTKNLKWSTKEGSTETDFYKKAKKGEGRNKI